ncbi:hypothetical protein OK016_29620 [Vibrio chagasii]|nr:hypothetical protein [Vibrio chagasii]
MGFLLITCSAVASLWAAIDINRSNYRTVYGRVSVYRFSLGGHCLNERIGESLFIT